GQGIGNLVAQATLAFGESVPRKVECDEGPPACLEFCHEGVPQARAVLPTVHEQHRRASPDPPRGNPPVWGCNRDLFNPLEQGCETWLAAAPRDRRAVDDPRHHG